MEWMFGITKGFDIVIGNPPYLESRHPSFSNDLKDLLQIEVQKRWGDDSKYITRGADLLIYFFESAIYYNSQKGYIVFITQNSWLDTEYGKKFQRFLLKKTNVKAIIDSDYKYFDSNDGPNINTVITLFEGKKTSPKNEIIIVRFHESFGEIPISISDLARGEKHDKIKSALYEYSNDLLTDIKWGILLSADKNFLELLDLLSDKALYINQIPNHRLTIGQGLNLTQQYIIDKKFISKYPFLNKAKIPFMTSSDGAPFILTQTEKFIINKMLLNKQELNIIQSESKKAFRTSSTRKSEPVLIMPRGIGRHFCSLNEVSAFSSSYVDVYDKKGNISEKVKLNLWLFFNSSICWLIREVSGRKNLGGGMLKAEAIDIKSFPVYLNLSCEEKIKKIYSTLKNREAFESLKEIETKEHKEIDNLIFGYLNISFKERGKIINLLKTKIFERRKKSRN
jgi:hypothetical protein